MKKSSTSVCAVNSRGMEVQQMAFDRERLVLEGWAISGVGDRIEALAVDARARDVHAVAGHKLAVLAQVDGGDGVFVSIAAAAARGGDQAEDASQQLPRSRHPALPQQFADAAAGDFVASNLHFRIDLHFEAGFAAIFR